MNPKSLSPHCSSFLLGGWAAHDKALWVFVPYSRLNQRTKDPGQQLIRLCIYGARVRNPWRWVDGVQTSLIENLSRIPLLAYGTQSASQPATSHLHGGLIKGFHRNGHQATQEAAAAAPAVDRLNKREWEAPQYPPRPHGTRSQDILFIRAQMENVHNHPPSLPTSPVVGE